jgi:protein-tyrosine phosphatase
VHCFAGKSRATSFTLAYLMKEKKITLKDGLDMIWKVRPIAAPNPGFMIQLKALEKDVFKMNSECDVM